MYVHIKFVCRVCIGVTQNKNKQNRKRNVVLGSVSVVPERRRSKLNNMLPKNKKKQHESNKLRLQY